MNREANKGGQVTIFILIAIVIVSAILVFFLWLQPTFFQEGRAELNFEGCVEDSVEQAITELEKKAGFINPQFTYQYDGEDFTYLCYTNEYYETCTVQAPFLKNVFDEQMEILIQDNIDTCYTNSLDDLEAQGYPVTRGTVEYDVLIEPGIVRVEVEVPTTAGSQSFARFNVRVNAPIYEMVMIATSILQSETQYGDADMNSIMILYPDYKVNKIKRGDSTTVYILENKITGNKFQFASRSLAWPAGYLLEQ